MMHRRHFMHMMNVMHMMQMMMHMNAKKVKSIQSQVSVCAGSLLARGLDEGGACYMRLYMYACMY